jgi:hypothetical protein
MEGEIAITVIATGFPEGKAEIEEGATTQPTIKSMHRSMEQRVHTMQEPIISKETSRVVPLQPRPIQMPKKDVSIP